MDVTEHGIERPNTRTALRLRRLALGFAVGASLVCAIVAGALGVFSRHASPYAALDAYTTAVMAGDRGTLDSVVGDSEQRSALIEQHADRPMTPTSVSMETTVSGVWWAVEIRYELSGQQPYSERLLVHPRSDSPDQLIDYVVDPAP